MSARRWRGACAMAAVGALGLAACGGGSPGSSTPLPSTTTVPPPSLTMRASSGAVVSLQGQWVSGCVFPTAAVPGGSLRETFVVTGTTITIEIEMYASSTSCSNDVSAARTVRLDARLGAESVANLAGVEVMVTRVEGTDVTAGEPFRQVFHVDDTFGADRLFHGIFEDDGGAVDAEGYPTELFEDFLARQ